MAENITRLQYRPDLEALHSDVMTTLRPITFNIAAQSNPFTLFTPWDMDQLYLDPIKRDGDLDAYPELAELYSQHVTQLNLTSLYSEVMSSSINFVNTQTGQSLIADAVEARRSILLDEFDTVVSPRVNFAYRDMNAIMSSQFGVARSIAMREYSRQLTTFTADITDRFAARGHQMWMQHVDWHSKVPQVYANFLTSYTAQRIDIENHNFELAAKTCLWPFTVFGHFTQILGSMAGSTVQTSSSVAGESNSAATNRSGGLLGGALAGAQFGSQIMPGWGTGIGAAVGAIGGLFS